MINFLINIFCDFFITNASFPLKGEIFIITRDSNNFLALLKPEYNNAINYCIGLCKKGKINEAEDIFQESLLKALENFENLSEESKFKSWLFTIITNTYISFYRKRFIRKFINLDEYDDIEKIHGLIPGMPQDEIYDEIYFALSALKEKEKIAFLLFEIGGFSIEEIRIIQKEKSSSAVKSRLSRTRNKLRNFIGKIESKNRNNLPEKNITDIEMETVKIINKLKP
jgi:RNA polymerase sigma-70 factor (ECF subfamily)